VAAAATPAATGKRPAFLDITYCYPQDFNRGTPAGGGSQVPLPPPAVPPGQELVCAQGDGFPIYADHLLVSLTSTGVALPTPPSFTATLIATSNHIADPTPPVISIFREDGPNRTAGTLVATCTFGTSCQVIVSADCPFTDYVAFLSPNPLASTQANSNITTVYGLFCFFPSIQPALPSPIPNSPVPPQPPKA